MRACHSLRSTTRVLVLALMVATVGGCAMFGQGGGDAQSAATQPATQPDQTASAATQSTGDEQTGLAQKAKSTAKQLAKAMSNSLAAPPGQQKPAPTEGERRGRVRWRNAAERSRPKAQPADQRRGPQKPDRPTEQDDPAAGQAEADPPATQPARPPLAELPREKLIDELVRRTRRDDAEPIRKAIAGLGLSLYANDANPPASLMSGLNTTQRRHVTRFHDLTKTIASQMLRTAGQLSRPELERQVARLFGKRPVQIQKLDLCRQVTGYGVYKPFQDHRFLSNQKHKLIVYVELDHFEPIETDNRYEVKLKQKVVLFNESDGLAVWSHDPVSIVDKSRNKRQDFFTVQLIELPQRLNVGKYRLKVRVTDVHGGSVDETTIPVQLVADQAIAQGKKRIE